ncbi:MAG: helix-turn-helix transcriptional regulator [Planctomycetes bacterium]|nr:helix-turn-helix transcriptional regulator [Planctomycetota bacterium]
MAHSAINGTALPDTNGTHPATNGTATPEAVVNSPGVSRELHRVSEVRVQQGASLRSVARKLNLSVQEVREQENGTTDLRITDLLQWQEILEVPLADLLIDSEGPLSEPVCKRARMLRIMKTAKAIKEGAHNRSVIRLANMLIGQLVEIMPELSEVAAWHTVGQRRTQEEVGRIVERAIPDSFFSDSNG